MHVHKKFSSQILDYRIICWKDGKKGISYLACNTSESFLFHALDGL